MNAFDNMVVCPKCPHGAGLHDGSGCSAASCDCRSTKETVMNDSIELMWQEDRERFRPGAGMNG